MSDPEDFGLDGPDGEHRCWGCGEAVAKCGHLCIDCSWEEHLAARAHTGEFDEPRDGTPVCCVAMCANELGGP